jgi:hypothetical protein
MTSLPCSSYEVINARLTGRVFFIASFIYQTLYWGARRAVIYSRLPSFRCCRFVHTTLLPGFMIIYQYPMLRHRPASNFTYFVLFQSSYYFISMKFSYLNTISCEFHLHRTLVFASGSGIRLVQTVCWNGPIDI